MKADGSGTPTNLTKDPKADDGHPAFSPSGTKVAFTKIVSNGGDGGTIRHVYKMNANGTGTPTNLTKNFTNTDSGQHPDFSPNGKKIAFTGEKGGNLEVYKMNADGTGKPINLTKDTADDYEPSWAPVP